MEIAKLVLAYIDTLVWPVLVLVALTLYRDHFKSLVGRIKKAELPGGISIETFPEKIEEAKDLSVQVKKETNEKRESQEKKIMQLPLTDANMKMLNHGLSPSPSGLEISHYKALAEQDPVLALAGLRIEVETMLKNLAKGFEVDIGEREGTTAIARKLWEKNAITSRQAELINSVVNLCNAAIHGVKVTRAQADEILEIAEVLRDEYISWLSWGFQESANKAMEPDA